jgi:hypothetical protein
MRSVYSLGIFLLLIMVAGCAHHHQFTSQIDQPVERGPYPRNKWTVLIYMSADNELDHYAMNNLHEMEAVAPPRDAADPGVTILVQLDRDSTNTAPGSWTDTRRYHIVRDPEMAQLYPQAKEQPPPNISDTDHPDSPVYQLPGRIPHTLPMNATVPVMPTTWRQRIRSPRLDLPPLGKLDMGDPQTLHDFILWGQQIAPADHYLVFTWGHGCGWMVDDDAPRGKAKSFCDDEGIDPDSTSINSAEISQALDGARPIDVLAMDNCMMAMFEVSYEVRRQVHYLTASEDEVPDRGFDYFDTLGKLTSQHGAITPATLARMIASNNQSAWQHFGFGNTLTNSTVMPGKTITAARALNTLARHLTAVHHRYPRALRRARTECIEFGMVTDYEAPSNIIDLGDYLRRLIRYVPDSDVRRDAWAAERAVRACVLANYTSPPYRFATGLSIFMPPATTMTRDYVTNYGAFTFCHDTSWLHWLKQSP